jgi:WD40 repeat protein
MPMNRTLQILLAIALLLPISSLAAEAGAEGSVGPAMRILKENCVSCHNPAKKKGKLVLTSRELALKGGEDGAVLEVGNAAKSPLILALDESADPHMPPKGQLTQDEIALLSRWINSGAKWDVKALAATQPATTHPIVLRALPASYRPVLCMALSPDGKRLAVGRGDQICLYDVTIPTRPMIAQLATPRDLVQSLAWSGDGRWLASGGFRSIRVWESRSGVKATEIAGLTGRVTALAFVPKEPVLIAGEGQVASTGTIRMWHVPDGARLADWAAHDDSILSMAVSTDGKWLATASADKLVKVWDLATRKETGKLEGHTAPVMALALSKDGTSLASAGTDKEIKIWKVSTKEQTASLLTSPAGVTDLVWVNEKTLLSTSEDGVARFSSAANKERAERVFNGAPDVLYCAASTLDGKPLFAGCHDGNVYVWNAASGKLEGTLPLAIAPRPATQPATRPAKPQK